jgi:hypothetical protein
MPAAPRIGIPPLAGICTLQEAARSGFDVAANVRRLLRYHWAERRLGEIILARIPATPEWEVKGAFALHQWLDAEHADALRRRIGELRQPMPRTDVPPEPGLEAFLRELESATDTAELLAGVYAVGRTELIAAYHGHLAATNPLVDHPTCRMLRLILPDLEQATHWGASALSALLPSNAERERIGSWQTHLRQYLAAAGGIAGDAHATHAALPASRAAGNTKPDMTPRRDERFHDSYDFDFPPHVIYNLEHIPAAERNLALLCKRLLEMDVPEMMASFLAEDRDMPWEHQLAYRRQLWDEARHSMMGEAAFEAAGIDWTAIPLNVGFSLRLNRHATARERELLLFAIEQSLMPGDVGKRSEYETAVAAGDALSALFHDYDWADEVLHAQIGRNWLKVAGMLGPDVFERGRAVHERTWRELDQYRTQDAPADWWRPFVRRVLGVESAVRDEDLHDPQVVANG